jgi:GNAT superfamily N-acetyltransferase
MERSRVLLVGKIPGFWHIRRTVVCFFVAKGFRKKGIMSALLRGAVTYAKGQGARVIESYPIDMQTQSLAGKTLTGYSGYMGIAYVFREIGFKIVGEASEMQLIMRYAIER